jgi:hypothetical protein
VTDFRPSECTVREEQFVAKPVNTAQGSDNPDVLVRNIEQTREQLAVTIDALVERTSPKNVAQRALDDLKSRFFERDGSPKVDAFAKVGGAVAGVVVVFVVLRRTVGSR